MVMDKEWGGGEGKERAGGSVKTTGKGQRDFPRIGHPLIPKGRGRERRRRSQMSLCKHVGDGGGG